MVSDKDFIYITKKQASIAVVSLTIFCILVFMLGYFWGKQCVLDTFGQRIAQESINDQVDYESMIQSFSDKSKNDSSTVNNENNYEQLNNNTENNSIDNITTEIEASKQKLIEPKDKNSSFIQSDKKLQKNPSPITYDKKYKASLISFCTKQSATSFVQRLQKHGIPVNIKARSSKSASGKIKKNWYQIVTNSYNSKEELEKTIEQIKKFENLKSSDIKIN